MKVTSLSDEVWRDIPGYEGIYQASTHGRIRTAEGKITHNKRYGERRWKSRILKGRGDNPVTGKRVSLWKDGKPKDFLVARLVAITFLGQPPEGYTVNHKDGNRLNNNTDNLEWLSLGDNIRHGFQTGLYPQKSTLIKDVQNEQEYRFRSRSQTDIFLKRRKGYTSEKVKKGHTKLTDAAGNVYQIISA